MHRNRKSTSSNSFRSGFFSVLMIAGVYGYFLLFSQFAFLEIVKARIEVEATIRSLRPSPIRMQATR